MRKLGHNDRQAKNYEVIIPYESFDKIKPQIQTKKRLRDIWKLQKGWTDIFLDKFYDQHGFPCSYAIKYHNVFLQSVNNDYIQFKGRCSDQNCRMPFFASIKEVPQLGKDVIINFLAINSTGIEHTHKRSLRQPKRNFIIEDVMNSGPSEWRRKKADKSIEFGDVEPPNLYESSVLRKAKQQYMNMYLGIENNIDPIRSIVSLKYEVEHNGSVHSIGFDPFFCHYWSPIQDHIYKTQRSKSWTTVYIDATGSLVLPIIRTKHKIPSAHIFLYQIVSEIENQTVPIAQQLSEKQDMLSIYYWMASWVNAGHKIPNECVCDYSKALIGAITRSFCNRKSLKQYNSMCFKYLIGETKILPECYVRIDIAHIIHMLCRWKCLKIRKSIKDFYVRCISLLIKTQNIKKFEMILRMIFNVASSETDGVDLNKINTPTENARKNLIEFISCGGVESEDEVYKDSDCYKGINEDDIFYFNEEKITSETSEDNDTPIIQEWIDNINYSSVQESKVVGDRLNALFCPDLIKPLIKLCLDFPLWSGVMVQYFGSPNSRGTSSRIEGYFSTLKTSIILKTTPRMRVDKFLVTHLRAIRGDVKLASWKVSKENVDNFSEKEIQAYEEPLTRIKFEVAEEETDEEKKYISYKNEHEDKYELTPTNNNYIKERESDNSSSNESSLDELEFENWRNKASPSSPKKIKKHVKRSIYLESCPEIKLKEKMNTNISKKRIDLVKNGNLLPPLCSTDLKGNKIKCKIINTCAFDALVQVLATAYVDSQQYANYVDSATCLTLKLVCHLVKQGANSTYYDKRLTVLQEFSKKKHLVGELIEYDAQANVATLIEKLFVTNPSIYQYHTCDNIKCTQTTANCPLFPIDQGKLISGKHFLMFDNCIY